jgi:elongator complex protein 3
MMPNLPGSTFDMDVSALRRVYEDSDFCPDEIKIYPCMVTPHSQLEKQWRA